MIPETNTLSYWLNWRFFLCALFILFAMGLASFLIWKNEHFNKSRNRRREREQETDAMLYEDELWKTCLKGIHPAWLLAYRIISFLVLSALLIANVVVDGGGIFYYYTQWTFTLVTIYFGLASSFSLYRCCFNHNNFGGDTLDAERDTYMAPTLDGTADIPHLPKSSNAYRKPHSQNTAGAWGHTIQIIFQTCAGAAMLTDIVFWLVLYPFMSPKDFRLGFRFPVFRFAYFILWTATFVNFQWIIHAVKSMWWPYPFLELSSPYAPLWYLAVGLVHIPCYGVFALIVKLKHLWLSKLFPGSCQFIR